MYIGPVHGTAVPETTPLVGVAALTLSDARLTTKTATVSTPKACLNMTTMTLKWLVWFACQLPSPGGEPLRKTICTVESRANRDVFDM
jgi:hypothetical protein